MRDPSFETLTPTRFLDRSADVYADRLALVDGHLRRTYAELKDRCLRQAGALRSLGVQPGDRVGVLAPNTSLLLEAHYGVLYAGAVLVTLNIRLAAAELAYIVDHAGCRVLIHDPTLADLAEQICGDLSSEVRLIDGREEYDALLASAEPFAVAVLDERGLMALNYTSGTTGRPKGAMYHHRGAYLQSLAMTKHFDLDSESKYLWTLPMFHCNGWCFTWAVTAAGATHVCLPRVDPAQIWQLLDAEKITHFCGAPTVLTGLLNVAADRPPSDRRILVAVGGAPPSPSLLEWCSEVGWDVTHLYGLTETFGPAAICDWRPEWGTLAPDEQAERRARQGVGNLISCALRVVDARARDVPRDGRAVGEVAIRGNNVMLGYFRDEVATAAAVRDGWFHTGDLGVLHPDGYLELRDRLKDVIISGGENISSIEVEVALLNHPAVLEAAVVAVPDETWGERPAAWVTTKPEHRISEADLRAHVRSQLAGFKVPDMIVFAELPKTGTGKIQKFRLREDAVAEQRRRRTARQ